MEATALIAVANGAIGIIETLAPEIAAMVKSGQISVADQQALQARITALHGSAAFTGPEWAQSTATPTVS